MSGKFVYTASIGDMMNFVYDRLSEMPKPALENIVKVEKEV